MIMEEQKGFNRSESQTDGTKNVFIKIGLILLSVALAVFTAIVVNI